MSKKDEIFEQMRLKSGIKTETEKKEAAERVRTEDERQNKILARNAEIRKNPDKLFWCLSMCGGGVAIVFHGLLEFRLLVPQTPEYFSVDNVIDRLLSKFETNDPANALNRIKENSVFGDSLRNEVFEAYKAAMNVYKWSKKNKCSWVEFPKKASIYLMYDYELKEFFKEKKNLD